MNFDELDKLAFKYMGKKKSHKEREIGAAYYHGKRVANGVIELRKKLFDDDSIYLREYFLAMDLAMLHMGFQLKD